MSRIWDALKQAQQQKDAHDASPGAGIQDQAEDRRRSEHFALEVPLFVYGHTVSEEPFYEETISVEVSSHGGVLILQAPVKTGQKLLLTNKLTQKEIECKVVHVLPVDQQKVYVGVAFAEAALDFWRLAPQRAEPGPPPPKQPA